MVDVCADCGLQKTQWTNTSRWHGSPNHHGLWKVPTGLQATWILCLSTLPPDSGIFISKWNARFTFIWKEDFGPLSNSPVIFLLSPAKMLLRMFRFQKWLDSPFPEDVWVWWLLMHWIQHQLTPCKALPSVWIGFAWQYSSLRSSLLLGFKEQEINRIYTVGTVIYWNSNVDILIFWDTGFWLSLAVSSNHQNKICLCHILDEEAYEDE